jgi:hypothetical protein
MLMDQLKDLENGALEFLADEKLRQDRLLEERRQARLKKKAAKALEVKQRQ